MKNTIKKLMTILVLSFAGTAMAAEHKHCICGDGTCSVGGHTHTELTWKPWTATDSLPTTADNWYLVSDVTLTAEYVPVDGVNLCLNGHKVTQTTSGQHVILCKVNSGTKTFCLTDCGTTGQITGGQTKSDGAGVRVCKDGDSVATFKLYGGTICGNKADLTLSGVTGDNAQGGGVSVDGACNFYMYGGSISNNTAYGTSGGTGNGGGLSVMGSGTAALYGGEICCNTASRWGGAISTSIQNFSVNGPVRIYGNTATAGGAICADGAVSVTGAKIFGNSATATPSGVTMSVSGGHGGIYLGSGANTISNCEVYNNTALAKSAGIHFASASSVTLSGTVIVTNNTISGSASNFGFDSGKKATLSSLASDSKIGVTTATAPAAYAPVAFTSNGMAGDLASFTSDNVAYEVRFATDHLVLSVPDVVVQDSAIDNTTFSVLTNGAAVAKVGGEYLVPSNATIKVVYTAADGYYFADGSTAITNTLTASTNPVVDSSAPSAPARKDYYVSASGSDANSGSPTAPFATITNAIVKSAGRKTTIHVMTDLVQDPFDLSKFGVANTTDITITSDDNNPATMDDRFVIYPSKDGSVTFWALGQGDAEGHYFNAALCLTNIVFDGRIGGSTGTTKFGMGAIKVIGNGTTTLADGFIVRNFQTAESNSVYAIVEEHMGKLYIREGALLTGNTIRSGQSSYPSNAQGVINIGGQASLYMTGGLITGNTATGTASSMINLGTSCKAYLTGGAISNNVMYTSDSYACYKRMQNATTPNASDYYFGGTIIVCDNKDANGQQKNIHIPKNATAHLSEELTGDAKIGLYIVGDVTGELCVADGADYTPVTSDTTHIAMDRDANFHVFLKDTDKKIYIARHSWTYAVDTGHKDTLYAYCPFSGCPHSGSPSDLSKAISIKLVTPDAEAGTSYAGAYLDGTNVWFEAGLTNPPLSYATSGSSSYGATAPSAMGDYVAKATISNALYATSTFSLTSGVVFVEVKAPDPLPANTTFSVCTNGVPVEPTGGKYLVPSNATDVAVVYTAASGYYFDDGTTAKTNVLTAAQTGTDPATLPAAPTAPVLGVVKVTTSASTTYYETLAPAFDKIGVDGTGTVTMLRDLTLAETGAAWVPDGSDITFDLAGKKIDWTTSKGDSLLYFDEGTDGNLTIKDSASGGTIISTCTSTEVTNSAIVVYCKGDGDLTVEGGTFICSNKIGAATLFFKDGNGDWAFSNGTYRAVSEGTRGADFLYCLAATGTTVIVDGDFDITAKNAAASGIGANDTCKETIVITGGDFDIASAGTWYGAFTAGNGVLIAKGGTFDVISSGAGVSCFTAERNGTTIISNGTFYAESKGAYAYAASACATGNLVIAGGTLSAKAASGTCATVIGKNASTVTIVQNPTINLPTGSDWNLSVQTIGGYLDFTGYTGANFARFAVDKDGVFGDSYVKGDFAKVSNGVIFDGFFSMRPENGWVQNGKYPLHNTNAATRVAYPWTVGLVVNYTPPVVPNTTATVCTNGVPMEVADPYILPTNVTDVTVIYTANPGYAFPDGTTAKTNDVDTTVNPATTKGTLPTAPMLLVKYVAPVYKGADGSPTNGVAYWTTNTCANYTIVTNEPTRAGHRWGKDGETTWLVVTNSDVVIDDYVRCFGHINLILCDGASLKVTNGIRTDSNALTIYAGLGGTGKLIAEGSVNGAGIGCGFTGSGNNITINGGRITAMGGSDGAAGIGGGYYGSASNIVINAGVVTAIGGGKETSGGAGIGGGNSCSGQDIVINGGTVVATGAVYSAGIGGGNNRSGTSIVINGGEVVAVGGGSGAGIGGGYGGVGTNIVIRGGKVVATGGDFGAGIGGGQGGAGSQIAISEGKVWATGGNGGAGIGGGSNAVGSDIAISGGRVLATGGDTAAGIGGGYGYDGSGSRITISSGTVTAIGGYLGAAIGGGMCGGGSQITIGGDTKVFVGGPRQIKDGIISAADLIGCGYESEDAAEDVTIDATAQVFFNLTGCYDENAKTMCEQVAPMPAGFGGFALMTPERQTKSRVLVGGCGAQGLSALPAFALTNAVTGATDALAVNGAEITFARTYCSLTNISGNLTFAVRKPVLTVTQQPNVTNAYSIVATTDGNNGITNYAWCVESETTTGFVALTNALEAAIEIGYTVHGPIEGTAIRSFQDDEANDPVIWLLWLPDDNTFGIAGIPKGGKLHFSCASDISADYEELLGSVSRIGETDEWVWDAKLYDISEGGGVFAYLTMLRADAHFTIDNLRWVAADYELVAQGPTLTALPVDKGVVGKKYVCRMDYGHEGVYYAGNSEVFTYVVPILAEPTPVDHTSLEVYTNGFLSTEIETGKWAAWSNETATVVYTAADGYFFADGSTAKTNAFDTSKNPATADAPTVPVAPVASVTTNGVTTLYGDINDAWSDALAGVEANPATLKLLANVKPTSCLLAASPTFDGRNITFDLNDHVLSPADTGYSLISFSSVDGSFKLVDTATTKTKKYFTALENGLWVLTNETTSLFVEGGVITGGKSGQTISLGNGAAVEIRDVSFVGNGSSGDCGALYVANAKANIYSTRFYGNVAKTSGGAIQGMQDGRFLLADCDIRHNVAGGSGGGIYMMNKCVLINTTISDNVAGTRGAGVYFEKKTECLAAGTKIRMADGTEKSIEDIAEGDLVATFDHEGGTNSSARIYLAYKGPSKARPFTLEFDTSVSNLQPPTSNLSLSIVGLHDLLEESSRKYVRITEANASTFVGKRFYGADGAWHTLTGVTFGTESVAYYSIYAAQHQNVYANGLLTVPDDADYLLNLYELNAALKADPVQLVADIETYGLADPDLAASEYGVDRQYFVDGNLKYIYIAIGKGLVTLEKLVSDFKAIGGGSETAPVAMPAPKMVKGPMLGATPSEPKLSDYDSFGKGVLVLGTNAVVTNNFVGAITNSNIHLASSDALIALADNHTDVLAGVTRYTAPGRITTTNDLTTVADVVYLPSDDSRYVTRFSTNHYLRLALLSTVTPTPVDNATFTIYTNGVPITEQSITLPDDIPVEVVYTPDDGYIFPDGDTAKTNAFDTTVNPAELIGDLPSPGAFVITNQLTLTQAIQNVNNSPDGCTATWYIGANFTATMKNVVKKKGLTLTILGNGYTITAQQDGELADYVFDFLAVRSDPLSVTVKDLDLVVGNGFRNGIQAQWDVEKGGGKPMDLTLENVNVTMARTEAPTKGGQTKTGAALINNDSTVTLKGDCAFTADEWTYSAIDVTATDDCQKDWDASLTVDSAATVTFVDVRSNAVIAVEPLVKLTDENAAERTVKAEGMEYTALTAVSLKNGDGWSYAVPLTPTPVEHTTNRVYAAGYEIPGVPHWVPSNGAPVEVVYTPLDGYTFPDGTTEKTNKVDTTKSPAEVIGDLPSPGAFIITNQTTLTQAIRLLTNGCTEAWYIAKDFDLTATNVIDLAGSTLTVFGADHTLTTTEGCTSAFALVGTNGTLKVAFTDGLALADERKPLTCATDPLIVSNGVVSATGLTEMGLKYIELLNGKGWSYLVEFTPTPVEHTTNRVYAAGCEIPGVPHWVPSNGAPVEVVYTPLDGYTFPDGTTEKTNKVDTTKSPAEVIGDLPTPGAFAITNQLTLTKAINLLTNNCNEAWYIAKDFNLETANVIDLAGSSLKIFGAGHTISATNGQISAFSLVGTNGAFSVTFTNELALVDERAPTTIATDPLIVSNGTVTATGLAEMGLGYIELQNGKGWSYLVEFTPKPVEHTTHKVFAADYEIPGEPYMVPSNGAPVYVVYTPVDGYTFPDGTTVKTNELDTTKSPAAVIGDLPTPGAFIITNQTTLTQAILALTNAANTTCKGDWYIGADFTVTENNSVTAKNGLDLRIRGNGHTITGAHDDDALYSMFYFKSSSTNDAELLAEDLNLVVSNGFRYAFNLQTTKKTATKKKIKYKTLQATFDDVDVVMVHSAAMWNGSEFKTGAAICNNYSSLALTNGCSFMANTNCWAAIDLTSTNGWNAALTILSDDITFADNRTPETIAVEPLVKYTNEEGGATSVAGMEKTTLTYVELQGGVGYSYVVPLTPTPVEHTTNRVYAAGYEIPGVPHWVPSNGVPVEVVYTPLDGYTFPDGTTEKTNKVDTTKSPAEVIGDLPSPGAFIITNQTTLTQAITALNAQTNGCTATWYIGADFTVTEENVVTKRFRELTILGNGYTLTADSAEYKSSAFAFTSVTSAYKEKLTFKDLALVVTNNFSEGIVIRSQKENYLNTVLDNVDITLAHAFAPQEEGVDVACVAIVCDDSRVTLTNGCVITADSWTRSAIDIVSTNTLSSKVTIGSDDIVFVDSRAPETIAIEPLVKRMKGDSESASASASGTAKVHLSRVYLLNGDGWSFTVPLTPMDVAHTTYKVYAGGKEIEGPAPYKVPSNAVPVEVVYTPDSDYTFPDGTTAKTNAVDTTVSPANVQGELPPAGAFIIVSQATLNKALTALKNQPDGCEETWYIGKSFKVTKENVIYKSFDKLTILGNGHVLTADSTSYYGYAFQFQMTNNTYEGQLDIRDLDLVVTNNFRNGVYLESKNGKPLDVTLNNVDVTLAHASAPQKSGVDKLAAGVVNNYSSLALTNGCSFTADKWSWAAIDLTSNTGSNATLTVQSDDITFIDNRTPETIAIEPLVKYTDEGEGVTTVTGMEKTPLTYVELLNGKGWSYLVSLTPEEVSDATYKVYSAGKEIPGPAPYHVPSNGAPVYVVYTPIDPDAFFEDGTQSVTNNYDTSTEPADNKGTAPESPVCHKHCLCVDACTIHGHACVTNVWRGWPRTDSLPTEAGYWYLVKDVTLTSEQTISADVKICFNGKKVTQTGSGRAAVIVSANQHLAFTDCSTDATGAIASVNGGAAVSNAGTFELYAGVITNGAATADAAVKNAGDLYLYGGAIRGNACTGILNVSNVVMTGGCVMNNAQAGIVTEGTLTVGGEAIVIRNGETNVFVAAGKTIALSTDEPLTNALIGVTMQTETGTFVTSGAKIGKRDFFFSDQDAYYVKHEGETLALAHRGLTIDSVTQISLTNSVITLTATGGVTSVWFKPTNAQVMTTLAASNDVSGWSWSFDRGVQGAVTNTPAAAQMWYDELRVVIDGANQEAHTVALQSAVQHLVIGNLEKRNVAALTATPTYSDWTSVVGDTVILKECPYNVVDYKEDVVNGYDGFYSLREVVETYSAAWDNASNVVMHVVPVSAVNLTSSLELHDGQVFTAASGDSGLFVNNVYGAEAVRFAVTNDATVTIDCPFAVMTNFTYGTNALVKMGANFVLNIPVSFATDVDLLTKGIVKILEPAEGVTTLDLAAIAANVVPYDPDGNGFTTVVIDNAIYLAARFTISYDAQDGKWPDGTTVSNLINYVAEGYLVPAEPPTREKYEFAGWYTSWTNGASYVDNGTNLNVCADHTIYAKWVSTSTDPGSGEESFRGKDSGTQTTTILGAATDATGAVSEPFPDGELALPDRIGNDLDSKFITAIAREAFAKQNYDDKVADDKKLTSVRLSSYLTLVGDAAFYACTNLTNITFAATRDYRTNQRTTIRLGSRAFAGSAITTLVIPVGTKVRLGANCFAQCTNLTEIFVYGEIAGIDNAPFSKIGSGAEVTVHLSPEYAADANFVARLTQDMNTSKVTISSEPLGQTAIASIAADASQIAVSFTVDIDSPWGVVNEKTVTLFWTDDLQKGFTGTGNALCPTQPVTQDPSTHVYTAIFDKPLESSDKQFYRLTVGAERTE